MRTELQTSADIRPPCRSDAFSMAIAGVTNIIGVTKDGERLVLPVENHPDFRAPQLSDAYEMASKGIHAIRGVIETAKGSHLVTQEHRGYAI